MTSTPASDLGQALVSVGRESGRVLRALVGNAFVSYFAALALAALLLPITQRPGAHITFDVAWPVAMLMAVAARLERHQRVKS